MGARLKPRTIALMDRCVASLDDHGPGTASQVARWIGTVPCWCQSGVKVSAEHHCSEHSVGWRYASMDDVRPALEHAVRRGLVGRDILQGYSVLYSVLTRAPDEVVPTDEWLDR